MCLLYYAVHTIIGFTASGKFGAASDGVGWGYNTSDLSDLSGIYITGDKYNVADSGYTWAYNWTEGTLENGFSESQISFFLFNESSGNNPAIRAGTQFDLPVIYRDRRLSSYFGRPTDYEGELECF